MPSVTTLSKTTARRHDPLTPLAEAIGSTLGGGAGKRKAVPKALANQLADALHQVLEATTEQGRNTRLMLMRHLLDIESQVAGIEISTTIATADDLISTAQAAQLLGYSRPYVAMLIDQNKLKGATVSAGGHRRVSRAAVLAWKAKHQVSSQPADIRAEGQKIGAYKSTEAAVVRRVKALAANR
ncbi:excisionase family DNA-binding protein [Rhodoferax sp.]|uniref:excisionase family DNA-binding protein n=1 Tax=Rhodoferax sp. TaxID=50421 RepID=UPI00274B8D0B|nr:excisionase family DNA-binding protein [Rhodoferax sp.]